MNALLFGRVIITVETVTPATASKWLEKNVSNRALRPSVLDQYEMDMRKGHWREDTPSPVCFDPEGNLVNAQHRLKALVKAGVSLRMIVCRNVPRDAAVMLDRGVKRTISDIAAFCGEEMFSTYKAALVTAVFEGPKRGKKNKSFDELLSMYLQVKDEVEWIIAHCRIKTKGINATTLAVGVRAILPHNNADRAKVARFYEVLATGIADGEHESPAIKLRDFIRTQRGKLAGNERGEAYNRAQSALRHFLSGTPISKLYGTESDMFPLRSIKQQKSVVRTEQPGPIIGLGI